VITRYASEVTWSAGHNVMWSPSHVATRSFARRLSSRQVTLVTRSYNRCYAVIRSCSHRRTWSHGHQVMWLPVTCREVSLSSCHEVTSSCCYQITSQKVTWSSGQVITRSRVSRLLVHQETCSSVTCSSVTCLPWGSGMSSP
jgi:hypothetical protein